MKYNDIDVTYGYFLDSLSNANPESLQIILDQQVNYERDRFRNFCEFFFNIHLKIDKLPSEYSNDYSDRYITEYFESQNVFNVEKDEAIFAAKILKISKKRNLNSSELLNLFTTLNNFSRSEGFISLESIFLIDFQEMDTLLEYLLILVCSGLLIKKYFNLNNFNTPYYLKIIRAMKAIQYGLNSHYFKNLF